MYLACHYAITHQLWIPSKTGSRLNGVSFLNFFCFLFFFIYSSLIRWSRIIQSFWLLVYVCVIHWVVGSARFLVCPALNCPESYIFFFNFCEEDILQKYNRPIGNFSMRQLIETSFASNTSSISDVGLRTINIFLDPAPYRPLSSLRFGRDGPAASWTCLAAILWPAPLYLCHSFYCVPPWLKSTLYKTSCL